MTIIPMHKAKTNLSQLVQKAIKGEQVYIGAYGKVQAQIIATNGEQKPKRIIGLLKGKLNIPDDFDSPLNKDILMGFEKD